MSKSKAGDGGESPEIASELEKYSAETRAKLREIRDRLEAHVSSFNGREMWYQERHLQFKGIAHITTDEWGVRVRFESDSFRTLTLSGRWDILLAYSDSLGAVYCGWRLSLECLYPELGTSYG